MEGTIKRTNLEWIEIVKRQQASGEKAEIWCKKNEINYNSMVDAAGRLRKQGLLSPPEKRTSGDWLELIKRQQESGQTVKEWCEGKGINPPTMATMIARHREKGLLKEYTKPAGGKKEKRAVTQWVEVSEATAKQETNEIRVEIGVFRIAVPAEFSEGTFLRVCKALTSIC